MSVDTSAKATVVLTSIALHVEGREDVFVDVSTLESLGGLKKHPFTIEEGTKYTMIAEFEWSMSS